MFALVTPDLFHVFILLLLATVLVSNALHLSTGRGFASGDWSRNCYACSLGPENLGLARA